MLELRRENEHLRHEVDRLRSGLFMPLIALPWAALLPGFGALLDASVDHRATLSSVARLIVPTLADWCFIDLLEEDGQVQRVEVAHADPSRAALAERLRRHAPRVTDHNPICEVIRTGQAQAFAGFTGSQRDAFAQDGEHLELLRQVAPTSAMVVPLVARGRTLGALTFLAAESGRRFGSMELSFAEELGRHAALAVDNSRLYQAERQAREAAERAEQRCRAAEQRCLDSQRRTHALLGQVAALVERDLGGPLSTILTSAFTLLKDGPEPRSARAGERILASGNRMKALLHALRDYLRLSLGEELSVTRHPTNLEHICRAALSELRAMYPRRQIDYSPGADGAGQWDAQRLELVIELLLLGVLEAHPGGAPVRLSWRRAEEGAGRVELSLQAEGLPLDGDGAGSLEHGADGAAPLGLRIGLVIAERVARAHGGRIERAREDSTLTFVLPLSA